MSCPPPIYGDRTIKTTALTYTVKQEQAAQRYFKAEDGQQFKLDENASQTLTFENEPKAALNVSLNYQKEYELERGNAPEYPLTGATMTLYEVKDDGTLEQVESINDEPDCDDLRSARPQALCARGNGSSGRILRL